VPLVTGIAAALFFACLCFFYRRNRRDGALPPRAAAELRARPSALPAFSSAPKAPPFSEGVAAVLRAADAAVVLAAAAEQRAAEAAAARGGAPQSTPVASAPPAKQRSGLCPCVVVEEPGWVVATRRNAAAAAAALSAPASEDLAAWEARAKADLLAVRAALHEEGLLMAKRDQPAGARAADEKLRLYDCCTPTGTFCTPKYASCCRHDSALAEFGSGVTLYFKLLKYLAVVSFLLSGVVALQVAYNVYSAGTSPGSDELGLTTAGALQPRNGSLLYVDASGTATMTAPALARLYAFLDLAGLALLLVSFFWVRRAVAAEEALVDGLTLTLQDYTVLLSPLPSGTTEACIREWVASASAELDAGALAEKINAEAAPGLPPLALPARREEVFHVARVTLIPSHRKILPLLKDLADAYTAREGALGALKARALRRAARRGACCGALRADVVDPVACQRPVCGMSDPLVAPLVHAELAVRHAAVEASAAMRALLQERSRAKEAGGSITAAAAFVTFEHAAAKDAFLTLYPNSGAALCCQRCFAPARQLRGAATRPVEAPQPSALLYHNLGVHACERRARVALANVLFLVLLSFSFLAIYFLRSFLTTLLREVDPSADCSATPVATFVDLLAGSSRAERALFNSTVPASNVMQYCLCAKQEFAALKSAAAITAHPMFSRCPFHACRSPLVKSNPVCQGVVAAKWNYDWGNIIIPAVLSVVNACFDFAAPFIARLRSHVSVEEEYAAMAPNLFFAKFFNSVVLQILVTSWTAGISDFTFNFYVIIGIPLLTTFISDNVVQYLKTSGVTLVMACLFGHRFHADTSYLTNTAASAVHGRLLGTPLNMATRLSSLLSVFFLAYVLSPPLPVFMALAGVAFTVAYWVDKGLFLYVHQRPPFTRSNLVKIMVNLIPLAGILHGAVATWLYGGITALYRAAPRVRSPFNASAVATNRSLRALLVPTLAALSSHAAGGLAGGHLPRALVGANFSAPLLSTFGCPCEGTCSASSTLQGLFTCPVSYSGCPFADGTFSPNGALLGSTDVCSTVAQPSPEELLCMYR
jgi:hypothetical protein